MSDPFAQLLRYVDDRKDHAVIELPLDFKANTSARLALLFDRDRDLRVIPLLLAMRASHPDLLKHLCGLAETAGQVRLFVTCNPETAEQVRAAVHRLAGSLFAWRAEIPPEIVPAYDGVVDWQSLAPDHTLRSLAKGFAPLGVVRQGARS